MKLATWNVMLPVSERRRAALRSHIHQIAPDVLVLTESHDGFEPGLSFSHSSAEGRDGLHKPEHRWVSIWSRYKLESIATSDEQRTAAVWVMADDTKPFIVFGTVLPWLGSTWRGHASAGGVAFSEALDVQFADWLVLRRDHPDAELFVLGDFNQDLVTPHYYGSRKNRGHLEARLASAGLVALTADGSDPVRRDSAPYACIDHIVARVDSVWSVRETIRWPEVSTPQRWMSDHFGVSVSLSAHIK